MDPKHPLDMWLAILIVQRALSERFRQVTGMTLDEWDEMNYQRIMASDASNP